jgi:RNA polymerase sigma-70 factor (ECF subfamily)
MLVMAGLNTLSERELLQLLSEGDHAAYTEIFHRYFRLIYTHAFKKLEDEEQAKDIVQEVFASLWFKRETAINIKDLAAYLFSSVRNKIFDLFAHRQVQKKHLDSLSAFFSANVIVSTDYHVREAQFRAYIDKQIQALPPKMRVVFEMSRKQELSYKEIAEQLSTSENNVSKQVNNALRLLRTKLNLFLILFI